MKYFNLVLLLCFMTILGCGSPEKENKSTLDLQIKCASVVKNLPRDYGDCGYRISGITPSDQITSHYNKKMDKCLAKVDCSYFSPNIENNPKGYEVFSVYVIDAVEMKEYARNMYSFNSKTTVPLKFGVMCYIGSDKCDATDTKGFEEKINKRFGF